MKLICSGGDADGFVSLFLDYYEINEVKKHNKENYCEIRFIKDSFVIKNE